MRRAVMSNMCLRTSWRPVPTKFQFAFDQPSASRGKSVHGRWRVVLALIHRPRNSKLTIRAQSREDLRLDL
jgi:hypothetical protein